VWAKALVSKAPVKKVRYYTDEEWQQIDAEAGALYDSRPSRAHAPPWANLSEVTRSVWHKMVIKEAHWQ
jgi:hypothetical protein